MHKKVILLWMEGSTDILALKLIIHNMLRASIDNFDERCEIDVYSPPSNYKTPKTNYIPFTIKNDFSKIAGDITTKEKIKKNSNKSSQNYFMDFLKNYFEKQILENNKRKFLKYDQIIHIIDTDACWIDDKNVKQATNKDGINKTHYLDNQIITPNLTELLKTRKIKRKNVELCIKESLTHQTFKKGVFYNIFFNSCNLEHVTYGYKNLTTQEKVICAKKFNQTYIENNEFIKDFLNNKEIFFHEMNYEQATKAITKSNSPISSQRHSTIDKITEVIKSNLNL